MVRFGFGLLGVHPAGDLVDLVRTADELGFHSCYLPDDPSMRDSWAVVAAAARETSSIRLGFNATHVYLRDPVLIAQALATLDELSDGSRPWSASGTVDTRGLPYRVARATSVGARPRSVRGDARLPR